MFLDLSRKVLKRVSWKVSSGIAAFEAYKVEA